MRVEKYGKTGMGNLFYDGWIILDKKDIQHAIRTAQIFVIQIGPHNLAFRGYVL